MEKQVGTFTVEEAFRITGRGWMLAGALTGEALVGHQLAFPSGTVLRVDGVEMINTLRTGKAGLLIPSEFASRQELLDQNIIGATARILE
ncbi:MAG TPA: hypothetical protein VK364_02395 [Hymenobacter sp.]|nr:hypothetical protein [Hymenobacter sp.]